MPASSRPTNRPNRRRRAEVVITSTIRRLPSPGSHGGWSDGLDPARRQARAVLGGRRATQLHGPHHERPPTSVRLQELEHPGIVGRAARRPARRPRRSAGGSRRRSPHPGRRAPARRPRPRSTARCLARTPTAHARSRAAVPRSPRTSRLARPPRRRTSARRRSMPNGWIGVVGESGERRRGRRQAQGRSAGSGRRRVLAVGPHEALPRATRLLAGHLLFEDRREECVQDGRGPCDADPGESSGQTGDPPVIDVVERSEPQVRSPDAEQARNSRHALVGTRPEPLDLEDVGSYSTDRDRDRSAGHPGRPPRPVGAHPDGPIAVAADERDEGPCEVERAVDLERHDGHTPSLALNRNGHEPCQNPPSKPIRATVPVTCDARGSSWAWRSSPS